MIDPVIVRDLETWADNKLRQTILDIASRYEMADLSERECFVRTATNVMVVCSMMLASTSATPEESGFKLVESIKHIRQQRKSHGR